MDEDSLKQFLSISQILRKRVYSIHMPESIILDLDSTLLNAYAIKMLFKNMSKTKADNEITDFTVYPLEGIWKKADGEGFDKDKLKYRLMIKQPDFMIMNLSHLK